MSVSTERGEVPVTGRLLGQASSRRIRHEHREPYVPRGMRCSACRWTRITILYEDDPEVERPYAVVFEGFSRIPGERTIGKVERTSSPLWVVECLHRRNREREKYISLVAKQALLLAAETDPDLRAVVDQRVVA